MTGPGKRDDELRAAVAAGVRAVTVESPGELARLEAIAREAGRVQPVLLRAAVSEHARLERVRLVGDDGAGKFGMDAADLVAAAGRRGGVAASRPAGAARVRRVERPRRRRRWSATSPRPCAWRGGWRCSVGIRLRLIDAGGGLGIPYEPHEESLDLRRAGPRAGRRSSPTGRRTRSSARRASCSSRAGSSSGRRARTWRASSTARPSTARSWSSSMAASTTCSGPALVGQEHRIRALGGRRRRAAPAGWSRSPSPGPLCSGLDVFSQGAVMTPPEVGDLVAVLDVGAYGFTESMPFFLSHPIPAEVAVRDGRAALIRPRQDPGEWLDRQVNPTW